MKPYPPVGKIWHQFKQNKPWAYKFPFSRYIFVSHGITGVPGNSTAQSTLSVSSTETPSPTISTTNSVAKMAAFSFCRSASVQPMTCFRLRLRIRSAKATKDSKRTWFLGVVSSQWMRTGIVSACLSTLKPGFSKAPSVSSSPAGDESLAFGANSAVLLASCVTGAANSDLFSDCCATWPATGASSFCCAVGAVATVAGTAAFFFFGFMKPLLEMNISKSFSLQVLGSGSFGHVSVETSTPGYLSSKAFKCGLFIALQVLFSCAALP
mmetsp:Transcript_46282/g.122243  ORF Transcript_46282/g.122243 Transcript_46282/m.122243 type:complete len:267 (-) Transcript_46282:34-834(-)